MDKLCVICNVDGKYKCPTCLVYYCSAQCCKKHRENACNVLMKQHEHGRSSSATSKSRFSSADTVPTEKLFLLKHDETLKNLLYNHHLRDLLLTINSSKDPERTMQMAMQEPLFIEFANACLKIVDPPSLE